MEYEVYNAGPETSLDRREREMRTDLYRAILRGDMEAAEDMMNMLAMVGIDTDMIEKARSFERM